MVFRHLWEIVGGGLILKSPTDTKCQSINGRELAPGALIDIVGGGAWFSSLPGYVVEGARMDAMLRVARFGLRENLFLAQVSIRWLLRGYVLSYGTWTLILNC